MASSRNQNYPHADGPSTSTHPVIQGLNAAAAQFANVPGPANQQKYAVLLATIDEIGKQVRPAHTGNKNAIEQMKRHIAFAKMLIRELMVAVDHNLAALNAKERRDSTSTSSNSAAGYGMGGGGRGGPADTTFIYGPPRKKSYIQ